MNKGTKLSKSEMSELMDHFCNLENTRNAEGRKATLDDMVAESHLPRAKVEAFWNM